MNLWNLGIAILWMALGFSVWGLYFDGPERALYLSLPLYGASLAFMASDLLGEQ